MLLWVCAQTDESETTKSDFHFLNLGVHLVHQILVC